MHKYVIMGVQGCGKGTQAKKLSAELDLTHVSVGDLFRWHVQSHTKFGARINRLVAAGRLVPDELVEEAVKTRLDWHDWNFGFVLDGFPRNVTQAAFFLESYDVDALLLIDVPDGVVLSRILARRLCSGCGLDYNLIHHRPAVADVCDVCGAALVARPDDVPEAIASRLADYHDRTEPVVGLFAKRTRVVRADGTGSPDEVYAHLRAGLGRVDE